MINMNDSALWRQAWKEAQANAPLKRHARDESNWVKVWDSTARQYLREILLEEPIYREILNFLVRERCLLPEDSVLDIGCGPGTYTFLFAEFARQVTGVDLSEGMLATLRRDAARRGLANIDLACSPWDSYRPEAKFDLVFGALTPALNNPDSLLKMEQCSRRSCCYVAFGNLDNDPRDALWELLIGEKYHSDAYHITYPLNLLYSIGRKPGLKFFSYDSDTTAMADELIRTYNIYFEMFTPMDDAKRKKISEYILSRSRDGVYRMKMKKVFALLYWNIPEARP